MQNASSEINDRKQIFLELLTKIPKLLFLSFVFLLLGCVRARLIDPSKALRASSTPNLSDDLDLESLRTALALQIDEISKKEVTKVFRFGETSISASTYKKSLTQVVEKIDAGSTKKELIRFIEEHFNFFEVYGDEEWGEVRVTSYFEPVVKGSKTAVQEFPRPVYGRPGDLLDLNLKKFSERFSEESLLKARLEGDKILPYYSRSDIDLADALKGKNLELCYLDPIDAFFLQIQGSGTVEFPDGSSMHLNYADKNGLRYEPIGKFMRNLIQGPITMTSIIDVLRGMPEKTRDTYLSLNPSYIFFRKSEERALTSSGIPATPGRTIATDSSLFPKGALAFMVFPKPQFSSEKDSTPNSFSSTGRFVIDQDSGGAIRGPGRVDLFWGRGQEAGKLAGSVNGVGRLYYLVPKSVFSS